MPATPEIEPLSLDDLRKPARSRSVPLVILLGAAIGAAFVLHSTPLQSANDRSRWCTVFSLVEEGTWVIDKIESRAGWSTIDKVRHDGHFYSSKPALFQGMVAGVYWAVQKTTGWNLLSETDEASRAILLIVNLLPAIVAWFLMYWMLERYSRGKYTKRLLIIAFIFATPIFTFLVTLNNHTFAACTLVFALAPALRILIDEEQRVGCYLAAGFFASLTFVNELPALSFLGILGLLLLKQDAGRTLKFFLPAALVPIVAAIAMTYWQTGGWKPFYAYYGTEKYVYSFEGIPSYWANPRSLDKNADSFPVYLLHCLFGHHGIFSLTPLFLLMVPAWFMPRWSGKNFRTVIGISALLTLVVLGFYLSRTQNYNYGGNTSTLRWLMWLIPLWTLSLIPVLDRFGEKRTMHIVAGLFLGIGCFSTFWSINNPWTPPWMFSLLDRYELLEQYDDPIEPFSRKHYAWFSSLPDEFDEQNPAFIELTGLDQTGKPLVLKLTDRGRADGKQTILIEDNLRTEQILSHEIQIDVALFEKGAKIDQWLIAPAQDDQARSRILDLLRGMPATFDYRPGRTRYVRTSLRTDAFTTQEAARRVRVTVPEVGEKFWFRCDSWYSDDLPFGVVQVKFSIARASGVTISTVLLTASDASSFPAEASPIVPGNPREK